MQCCTSPMTGWKLVIGWYFPTRTKARLFVVCRGLGGDPVSAVEGMEATLSR